MSGVILFAIGACVLFMGIRRIDVVASTRRHVRAIRGKTSAKNADSNRNDDERVYSDSSGEGRA